MATAIKVLWLIKGLGAGGAERLLVSAARLGDHNRFDYEAAYVVPEKNALVPLLAAHGVPSRCLAKDTARGRWPLKLRAVLLEGGYDIVHVHSPLVAGVARLVVRTLPAARRPAVFSTEHNTWDSYSLPTRFLNASLCRTDARRWAVSRRVRDSMWPPFRAGVDVLVHGIVLADLAQQPGRDASRRALGWRADEVVAVTVANFRSEKAYPDLLRAMARALAKEPRLSHVIVGQGPLAEQIEADRLRLGLDDRCRILGYREDVMSILNAADMFVLASHHEGFPVAVMEALAAGLPIVATSAGGIPDAVRPGIEGFLVEPGDTDAMSGAILSVASDESLRSRMAQAARSRGRSFDVRPAVAAVEAAYVQASVQRPSRQSPGRFT